MGYFAVIGDENATPTVERAHINLWRYDGLTTSRVCCFDVGLALTATTKSPGAKTFRLALPFSSECDFIDLAGAMKTGKVASLIFGRAVDLQGDRISYTDRGGETVSLQVTHIASAKVDTDKSGHGFSTWIVELPRTPKPDELLYIRLRFHVAEFSRAWKSHRDGELIDLRVADARESVDIMKWAHFRDFVVPLPNLRIFIIAPADLLPTMLSPASTARALEGTVWSDYTNRNDFWKAKKPMAIYGFKPSSEGYRRSDTTDAGDPVSASNPFRLYFRLGGRPLPRWLFAFVLGVAIFFSVLLGRQLGCVDSWAWARELWTIVTQYATGLSLTSLLLALLKWGHLFERIQHVGKIQRKIDRWALFKDAP